MNRKIRKSESVIGLVCLTMFLFLIAGCAAWKISPEHTYLKALRHFNNTVETYEEHYQAQIPETQAKWKEQIDPLTKLASSALDTWRDAISDPQVEINYRQKLSDLIRALLTIGVVEVKEE